MELQCAVLPVVTDDGKDLAAAVNYLGHDARPTGRLRLLETVGTPSLGILQQEWTGTLGKVWLDVPRVRVSELPPPQYALFSDQRAEDRQGG